MKYIEFVCTRNEGRSPVAEFIGQWYLEKKWLDKVYTAISSGSHRIAVDPHEIQSTSDENIPFESLKKLIFIGIEQKIFSQHEEDSIQKHIEEKNIIQLRVFFSKANSIFKNYERHFRADAIHRIVETYEIKGYLKAHSDQTEVKSHTVAIFAMSPNNTEKVREIYEGVTEKPLIETLSAYVTGDEQARLPNAFAQGEQFYHDVINQLVDEVPIAIDKFIASTK